MDARNQSPKFNYDNENDSDDDLFDPRQKNRPPSPFPADVHLHRLQQKNNSDPVSSSTGSNGLFSSPSSSSTRPPISGLKKLALNENDTKQSSGAIPKQNAQNSGNFFPSLLKRPSSFDSRNDSKTFRNTLERKRQPIGSKTNYFPSISHSPRTDGANISSNDADDDDFKTIKDLFSFVKPNNPAETTSARSSTLPNQGPDSDRQSSGYGSDTDETAGKKQQANPLPLASANRNKRSDESVITISSDDDATFNSNDVVAKPTNIDTDQMQTQDDGSISMTSRPSSTFVARKSLKGFGPNKFSLRNSSLSGTKRKRPISLKSTFSDINDRRSNKRNSNNPATSSHVIDSDSDVELLSALHDMVDVGDATLLSIEQLELNEAEAFARQLQSDEALARQLQAEFDAESTRSYGGGVRRRYFGGRHRPPPPSVEQRETSMTPPMTTYPSSRSPSLSPESESSRDRPPRRWPRQVSRRNSDSPTLAAVLAASMEDSPPRDNLPRCSIGRRSRQVPRSGMEPVRPGRSNRLFEDARYVGGDRGPLLGHAVFVPPRITPGLGSLFGYELVNHPRIMHLNDFLDDSSGFDFESLLDLADRIGDGRHGLQPTDIERLTTKKIFQEQLPQASSSAGASVNVDYERESCSICMSDYAQGHEMRILPCIHNFHKDCVDQWLKQNTTCPICRIDVRQ